MTSAGLGIIFDMDDLLADTRSVWRTAEEKLFLAMGGEYDAETAKLYSGRNAFDLAAVLYGLLKPSGPLRDYQLLLQRALVAEYARGEISPMPGAVGLVRRLNGLAPMAVASGSPQEGIEKALAALGIRGCFRVTVSSESVANGKPAPEIFLKAAEMLGVPAPRCLVFEDSLVGVRAAVAAGMRVFAVPSGDREEIQALATRVFGSLEDVKVEDVLRDE